MNMNSHMTKPLHGLYSLSILIVMAGCLYFIIIQPVLIEREKNFDRIETLIFQLNKFKNTNLKIKLLNDEINTLKSASYKTQGFLKNNPSAIVAADLQKNLKKVIESNGGSLISTHVVKQTNNSIFPEIKIKTHMRANIKTLRNVFYKLATTRARSGSTPAGA